MQTSTEFWIVPTDEHWRWQVVNDRNEVTSEGTAETMREACECARHAARNRH
jgi:histone H3/H4